jgi:type IV secretion system protein TrbL
MDKTAGNNNTQVITDCWSCGPLQLYLDKAESFTGNLSDALTPAMLVLFLSLLGAWIIYTGIRVVISPGSVKGTIANDGLSLLLASILLGGHAAGLITGVYTATMSVIGGAASTAFEVAGASPAAGYSGLTALLASMEQAIIRVVRVAAAIADEGGMSDLAPYIYSFLLLTPFVVMVVLYLAQVIMSVFNVVAVTAMAPVLALFVGFNWGRQMAVSGIKVLISSGLILFACTLAMALAVSGVTSLDLVEAKEDPTTFASLDNPDLLVVIAMGFLGIAMMSQATSLANSIAGTFLSSAGATMIAGTAGTAAKKGMQLTSKAASNFVGNASDAFKSGQAQREARAERIEAMRNDRINQIMNANSQK